MANGKNTTKRKTTTKNSSTAKKNAPVKRSTTAKKSAPAKKNTVTKNSVNKPVQKEPYVPTEQDIKLKNEIVLLVGLAITVLLTLANFGLLSPFGDYLSYFMFGLFGFLAYGLPV